MDNLVRRDDAEIFVEVSCILNLEDSPLSSMQEMEDIRTDDDHDQTMSQFDKVQRTTERNRQLQTATSAETVRSYEEIQGDKIFQSPLNMRHYNRTPLTRLLRMGTGACCHFQESTR